jgi:hypothetical protein
MVDAVRHFSTFEWYRVEARCATCDGVSELKLVAGVFLCAKCLGVGSPVLGEGSEVVSSTPPARPHSGLLTRASFPSDRIVGDDTIESGGHR